MEKGNDQPKSEPTAEGTPISILEKEVHHINMVLSKVLGELTPLFIKGNLFIFGALIVVFAVDQIELMTGQIQPQQRIIDKAVVMALIGALAAEISVVMIAAIKKMK